MPLPSAFPELISSGRQPCRPSIVASVVSSAPALRQRLSVLSRARAGGRRVVDQRGMVDQGARSPGHRRLQRQVRPERRQFAHRDVAAGGKGSLFDGLRLEGIGRRRLKRGGSRKRSRDVASQKHPLALGLGFRAAPLRFAMDDPIRAAADHDQGKGRRRNRGAQSTTSRIS